MGSFFCQNDPYNLGKGFKARAAASRPYQIWVSPPLGLEVTDFESNFVIVSESAQTETMQNMLYVGKMITFHCKI